MSEAVTFESVTVGILGLGNMGGAIAAGLVRSGFGADRLVGYDPSAERAGAFAGTLTTSAAELVAQSDVVVVAVKPGMVRAVLGDAFAVERCDIVVSVAAGLPLATIRAAVGTGVRTVVRVMPNTAAAVGCSTSALVAEAAASSEDRDLVGTLFARVGEIAWMSGEDLMHVATAVVGSAPAFVYVMAEALADAAVLEGLPRADARRLVASMIRGAGELLLAHAGSPAELKDRVASPGGTTIRGLEALEDGGFRATLIDAVVRTTERSRELA